jgi:hypothetical protein
MRFSTFSSRHDECVSDLAHVSTKGAVPLLLVHLHNYDARAALALVQSHFCAEQCDARLLPLFARVMAASLVGAPIQLIAPYSESRLSCANLSDVLGDYSARLSAADLNSYTDKDAADCWWLALVAVRPHRSLARYTITLDGTKLTAAIRRVDGWDLRSCISWLVAAKLPLAHIALCAAHSLWAEAIPLCCALESTAVATTIVQLCTQQEPHMTT